MKLKKGKAVENMAKKNVVKKKKKHVVEKKKNASEKKNIAEVTTDDFFNQDFDNMDLTDSEEEQQKPAKATKPSSKRNVKKVEDNDSDSGKSDLDPVEHKKSLKNLKDIDPEFFNYLRKNDTKLLDFNVDDDDADDDDNILSGDEDGLKHIPDDDLEIGSDESDYEASDSEKTVSAGGPIKVTLKLLKTWQEEIQKDKSSKTIKCVVEAFHAALETVSDSENQTTQYKVEGGAIFNGIVQLCIMLLPDAFKRFLKLTDDSRFEAHKAKRFPKIKRFLKSYLSDLIKVFGSISSANIISTLLKHLHQMLPYTQSFSSLRKPLLRILLKYWSTGEEESIRVVAFLCIVKIAMNNTSVLNGLMKTMYIKYVENSKFVSPTTLPGINFMRHSLVEMYLLDSNFSYYNSFLYVRQLAIHLRNAVTLKKKEHFQAVYNWQYINSLWFWSELIPRSENQSLLRNLVYPLVQIIVGVIKLIPTAQYYPLRFHCVKMLINISRESRTFIPSLPFLLQILEDYDFDRKHKIVSMKPMSLMCLLRASKSQQQENGYKDALIENVYELILESAAKDSHAIYFPDMYIFCIVKMKEFQKKCHVANYCRKIKQLLEKIEENRKFIEAERAKQTFDLKNMKEIESWEEKIKNIGTPANKFYESWVKVHQVQKLKLLTQNDEIADYKLPTLNKSKRMKNRQRDSDEDSDLEVPVEEMERRLKKAKKPQKKTKKARQEDDLELPTDSMDVVQDIKSDDWD